MGKTARRLSPEPAKTGRPRMYPEHAPFDDKVEEYFESEEGKTFPTLTGISLYLGFSDKQTFSDYADYGEDFSLTVNKARMRIEHNRHKLLIAKDTFTPGIIFDLENNHGWKDRQELEHSGQVAVSFSTVYEQRPNR